MIGSAPPGMCWHGAGPSLKLSHGRNGPGLEEISDILAHLQNAQIGVANKPSKSQMCMRHRAPCLRHTLRIDDVLPVEPRQGAGLPLKPLCSQNGAVLEGICGILVHPQNVLADDANKRVANTLFTIPRRGCGTRSRSATHYQQSLSVA